MNAEITEYINGWVLYDADCALCRNWVDESYPILVRRGFHPVPLQARWVRERLGIKPGEDLSEMRLLRPDGCVLGGADAFVQIARAIWWAWPFYLFAQMPGARPLLRMGYRKLARERHCLGAQCKLPSRCARRHRHLTSAFYELP